MQILLPDIFSRKTNNKIIWFELTIACTVWFTNAKIIKCNVIIMSLERIGCSTSDLPSLFFMQTSCFELIESLTIFLKLFFLLSHHPCTNKKEVVPTQFSCLLLILGDLLQSSESMKKRHRSHWQLMTISGVLYDRAQNSKCTAVEI